MNDYFVCIQKFCDCRYIINSSDFVTVGRYICCLRLNLSLLPDADSICFRSSLFCTPHEISDVSTDCGFRPLQFYCGKFQLLHKDGLGIFPFSMLSGELLYNIHYIGCECERKMREMCSNKLIYNAILFPFIRLSFYQIHTLFCPNQSVFFSKNYPISCRCFVAIPQSS